MRFMLKLAFYFLTLCALILDAGMMLLALLLSWGVQ
jgi:hypothetical protein